jgi:hypothetical protein
MVISLIKNSLFKTKIQQDLFRYIYHSNFYLCSFLKEEIQPVGS